MFQVTERVRTIKYAIRDVLAQAKQLERQGKEIIYLNIGDPVKYDFDTPNHIKQALAKAVDEGANWYAPSEGLPELKEAICEKEKRVNEVEIQPEDVVVTHGISEGIQMVMAAIVENGDEILVPGPTYPPYISYCKFFGGKPVAYETLEENGWQPNVDDLREKITAKTRAIVVINPNNPSGALYRGNVVKEIIDLAGEHNLLLISDEIYDRIVYQEKFVSTSCIARDVPVVGLNGFSKTYLMTGWRLGYIYVHDSDGGLTELKECLKKEARVRLSANAPVQKAGVSALRGSQKHILQMMEKLRSRRDYARKRLNEIAGVSCTNPEGAFYVFPKVEAVGSKWKTDAEFVYDFLEETGVLFVHGSGFEPTYGYAHFRSVILPPIEMLEAAFNLLEQFLSKHSGR
ncbi:MAG: aminotransferase class I/II-fold pyridoxal phosphate-dependent enzyme [Candidatus Bathyarchaeota archaeon]